MFKLPLGNIVNIVKRMLIPRASVDASNSAPVSMTETLKCIIDALFPFVWRVLEIGLEIGSAHQSRAMANAWRSAGGWHRTGSCMHKPERVIAPEGGVNLSNRAYNKRT